MTNPRLYRALCRRSASIYVSKLCFAVVWLGQIHNLDAVHFDVLVEIWLGTTLNRADKYWVYREPILQIKQQCQWDEVEWRKLQHDQT